MAGSLIRDIAALNKMEMAPWDVWGAQPGPHDALDLAFFDGLAELAHDPDDTFSDIQRRYEEDDRLSVPPTVFNALSQRREAIDIAGETARPRAKSLRSRRHEELDIGR